MMKYWPVLESNLRVLSACYASKLNKFVVSVMTWLHFTPGERTPGTHWIGGWVGLRAGLDAEARRKFSLPCQGLNPIHLVCSQTLLTD
jgi:hypothetical protein